MPWQRTLVSPPEARSESELKRLRAYEGLVVALLVIAGVLVFGSIVAVAVSSSLNEVARALGG